jgi:hypothetical protein
MWNVDINYCDGEMCEHLLKRLLRKLYGFEFTISKLNCFRFDAFLLKLSFFYKIEKLLN